MLRENIRKLAEDSMGMQFRVLGGPPEEGRVMLDMLELLLPIPTRAKMERWRKMVDTEEKTMKRQKCTRDIFVHHVHRLSE